MCGAATQPAQKLALTEVEQQIFDAQGKREFSEQDAQKKRLEKISLLRPFCKDLPSHREKLTSSGSGDPVVQNALKKFSPIFYLHLDEKAFPTDPRDYFEHENTRMIDGESGKVLIERGLVTMQKIDQFARASFEKGVYDAPKVHFAPSSCIFWGSDPRDHMNSSGDLITPMWYLSWYGDKKKTLYLQFLCFYGYNSPYTIDIAGNVLLEGDKEKLQNAHEADLEHVTIEIDLETDKIIRIFFGAHGVHEGMWATPGQFEVEGTHPVIYVAKGGHGNYPRKGTWVRIYGFGNDLTMKGFRWTPLFHRAYAPVQRDAVKEKPETFRSGEKGYNPQTMGWLAHIGNYGKRGVRSAWRQRDWFNRPDSSTRTFEEGIKIWCETGDTKCINKKAVRAGTPGSTPSAVEKIAIALCEAGDISCIDLVENQAKKVPKKVGSALKGITKAVKG